MVALLENPAPPCFKRLSRQAVDDLQVALAEANSIDQPQRKKKVRRPTGFIRAVRQDGPVELPFGV